MWSAGLTFIAMLGHIVYGAYVSSDFVGHLLTLDTLLHLVDAFIISVSIIVVAVPEGLPLSVTIALAYSVGKMKDENNLVRFLQACETMGGADNICSDKTGTLTMNKMTVTRFFLLENTIDNPGKANIKENIAERFSNGVCVNSSANPIFEGDKVDQIGNKTDCALLELAHKLGFNYREVRKTFSSSTIKVIPFSSDTKSMSTVVKEKGKTVVYCKGAPDFVLKNCSSYLDASGQPVKITDAFKNTLKNKLQEFADGTLRTLLITYKEDGSLNEKSEKVDIEKDLTIIGMVGIKDPIREAVPGAVKKCFEAGVRVRMITGDNPATAVAIAKEAGILEAGW